jgi:hypothetical protein
MGSWQRGPGRRGAGAPGHVAGARVLGVARSHSAQADECAADFSANGGGLRKRARAGRFSGRTAGRRVGGSAILGNGRGRPGVCGEGIWGGGEKALAYVGGMGLVRPSLFGL